MGDITLQPKARLTGAAWAGGFVVTGNHPVVTYSPTPLGSPPAVVPSPTAFALGGIGLALVARVKRRRRRG